MSHSVQSSTVATALAEAESRRHKARAKSKDRKAKRRGGRAKTIPGPAVADDETDEQRRASQLQKQREEEERSGFISLGDVASDMDQEMAEDQGAEAASTSPVNNAEHANETVTSTPKQRRGRATKRSQQSQQQQQQRATSKARRKAKQQSDEPEEADMTDSMPQRHLKNDSDEKAASMLDVEMEAEKAEDADAAPDADDDGKDGEAGDRSNAERAEEASAFEESEVASEDDEEGVDDDIAVDIVEPEAGDEEHNQNEDGLDDEITTSPIPARDIDTASYFSTPTPTVRSSRKRPFSSTHTLPSTRLSTFPFYSSQISFDPSTATYTLRMRAGDSITFHGSVAMEVEEGYVQVYGHTLNPRSCRRRRHVDEDGHVDMQESSIFHLHSWRWHPQALLSVSAKAPTTHTDADEIVSLVRLSACSSRFAPHRMLQLMSNDQHATSEDGLATSPTPCADPYRRTEEMEEERMEATPVAAPSSSKRKGKKQRKSTTTAPANAAAITAAAAGSSTAAHPASSSSFLQLHIPGFTPVLYADDDFRDAPSDRVGEDGDGDGDTDAAPSSTKAQFAYNSVQVPDGWMQTINDMLAAQPPTLQQYEIAQTNDEDSDSEAPTLSKAQQVLQRAHGKAVRAHVQQHGLRILVYGARNTGKSTFLRLLTNTALNKYSRVAYLDLDVGQTSLNPPGMIGLHLIDAPLLSTSPHTFMGRSAMGNGTDEDESSGVGRMVWSYFVGDVTHGIDPQSVLHATQEAIRIYESRFGPASSSTYACPLLINTQGWLTGLGFAMLQTTVQHIVQPAYLVEMRLEQEGKSSNQHRQSGGKTKKSGNEEERILTNISHPHQLYILRRSIDPVFAEALAKSPASGIAPPRQRQLQLLAYLTSAHARLSPSMPSIPFCFAAYASNLSGLLPYRVPFKRVCIEVLGLTPGIDYDPSRVLQILDSGVIALCVRNERKDENERHEIVASESGLRLWIPSPTPLFDPSQPPAFTPIECVGVGVIRSIDIAARCFYLLTPLSASQLTRVNLWHKGKLDLPNVAFGRDSYAPTNSSHHLTSKLHGTPYLGAQTLSASMGAGSKGMSSRHGIQRKRLQ